MVAVQNVEREAVSKEIDHLFYGPLTIRWLQLKQRHPSGVEYIVLVEEHLDGKLVHYCYAAFSHYLDAQKIYLRCADQRGNMERIMGLHNLDFLHHGPVKDYQFERLRQYHKEPPWFL